MLTVLDGAIGTELERQGFDTAGPGWSARAIHEAPERVAALHAAYARAGAQVHTANTFRATPRGIGSGWREAARRAVALARGAGGRVAGSMAPLEDCWHPERSPADPGPEHREIAEHLAACGVDLLLCETFAHPGEALAAVDAAVGTGLEVWLSLTAGPDGTLMEPATLADTARRAAERGAARVLVNCVHADRIGPFVEALAGTRFGVYANAGLGPDALDPEAYAERAQEWVAAGADVVGGCCGTGPAHVAAVVRRLRAAEI